MFGGRCHPKARRNSTHREVATFAVLGIQSFPELHNASRGHIERPRVYSVLWKSAVAPGNPRFLAGEGPIFSGGVGLTASAVHRRQLLGVFGQFSPLLSEVQIHLPNCSVRRRHSEPLAFRHLFRHTSARSLIWSTTDEQRRTFLWVKARCLIRQSSVRPTATATAARG